MPLEKESKVYCPFLLKKRKKIRKNVFLFSSFSFFSTISFSMSTGSDIKRIRGFEMKEKITMKEK